MPKNSIILLTCHRHKLLDPSIRSIWVCMDDMMCPYSDELDSRLHSTAIHLFWTGNNSEPFILAATDRPEFLAPFGSFPIAHIYSYCLLYSALNKIYVEFFNVPILYFTLH